LVELNRMRDEPVTESELELAKNYMAGAFARSLENPSTIASFAMNTNMYNLPKDYYETYLQKLEKVTVQDVQAMAKKYIDPSKVRIIVVGNKDDVMPKLTPFDKEDGKVQLYDIYANPRKESTASAADLTPEALIQKYFEAIGGWDKLRAVKSMDQTYSMELMGMQVTTRMVQHDGKFHMAMTAPGMRLMKQTYDGNSAVIDQMGQRVQADESMTGSMKEQSGLFPEQHYGTDGYKAEVKGVEDVDARACYRLVVTKPSGTVSTEYYDAKTFLKVKEMQVADAGGQT